LFHAATEESTAAPGEKTTAVPSGKTPNSMEKEKKRLIISNNLLSAIEFQAFLFSLFLFHFASLSRIENSTIISRGDK